MQQSVANAAGVDKSLVTINVAAASVIITATIAVPASTTAATLRTTLTSTLGTAVAASTALGITVENAPTVAVLAGGVVAPTNNTSIEEEPSDVEKDSGDVSTTAIIGATVGALVLGTLLGGWLVCRMCVKKREVAKRVNSQLAGVPTQKTRSVEVVLEGSAASGTEISEVDKRDRI